MIPSSITRMPLSHLRKLAILYNHLIFHPYLNFHNYPTMSLKISGFLYHYPIKAHTSYLIIMSPTSLLFQNSPLTIFFPITLTFFSQQVSCPINCPTFWICLIICRECYLIFPLYLVFPVSGKLVLRVQLSSYSKLLAQTHHSYCWVLHTASHHESCHD